MQNLTIVIPYFQEREALLRLLATVPTEIPVIVVDDKSDEPLYLQRKNTKVVRLEDKGYFTGAVNSGIIRCNTDVLVLNQDVTLQGTAWMDLLATQRDRYALIGERIKGNHPSFPNGYVHGVFQFMRRDAITKAGLMDEVTYPLWGASALWQWQICRKGFKSKPMESIPGLWHEPRPAGDYGSSIRTLLDREPQKKALWIRTPPMISVVIPCYNHGKYIQDAVNSLLGGQTSLGMMAGQTFKSFEVVIVDDGSDRETANRLDELVNGWDGVRVVRQHNRGTAGANNSGIKVAAGRYFTIQAADDMREPWSLEDLYLAAQRNPDKFVYDEPTVFAEGKRGKTLKLSGYDCAELKNRNMVPAGILAPKAAWVEAGGYPEQMVYGREDWAFNIALALKGWYGHRIDRSGYLYRREGQNRSLHSGDLREQFLTQLARIFPQVYKEDGMCCGDTKTSKKVAMSAPRVSFNARSVPTGMVLVEYSGSNVGNETWGGPGTVPTGRYYTFGQNKMNRIKFVDANDVEWFLNRMQNGKRLFALHTEEPATQTPASTPIQTVEVKAKPEAEKPEPEAVAQAVPEPVTIVATKPAPESDFFKPKRGGKRVPKRD